MEQLRTFERLSLNQITTNKWSMKEAIDGCARAEIPWIGIWRHKIEESGLAETKRLVRDTGLKVSSVCRGGMFPAVTAAERVARLEENKRAVEEAAELGTDVLVMVCGAAPNKDLEESRKWVAEGIEKLVPYAQSYGVKLGIEPLHPMQTAERSVVVTLAQANDLAVPFAPEQVGVVIDVYHVWWDPDLYNQIERAKGRIFGFHVCDWTVPTPDLVLGRGMMGDGVIEIPKIRQAVEATGYNGPIEVEIFNQAIWDQTGDKVLSLMKKRYLEYV